MSHYVSAESPKLNEQDQFNRNVQDTSKAIQEFHQTIKSIQQKMTHFNTANDNRMNHQQLKELTEKGNKSVSRINKRLQDLVKACQGPSGRMRKTQVNKLSNDYKNLLKSFEQTCEKLVESETAAISNLRKSSSSFRKDEEKDAGLGDYSEDQIYSKASIKSYNEDDLARREEDLVHINHQMREVNAAFKEVDEMVTAQEEVVVQINDDVQDAADNVDGALDNVRQADLKRGYCQCTKTKMIMWGILLLIIVAVVAALASTLK
ncbi:hypothetical protein Poli38472_000134 [Pythium oligandrum]|uniref:t-SNARE coiled-coil homology domain-containing protein n=1 Tax=Pythium oligandrum TaxID=41045 RepID=A0A8K1FHT5_PYTOL|nr:hypothetical protein Poli38472_000134 [Pythium oligandrum]|eukprot:TMW60092.1 hypothetical protein Poli38472_000134 [Pythium oligandrum]